MMGTGNPDQSQFFYAFSLEQHVPKDHLLRGIDRFLDLSDLPQYLAEFYSQIGRPSIDPKLMIRMLIIGYCFGIRSERRLCEEVHLNLAYRWFCRLDLEDKVPDHSTFSKNRHGRFRDSHLFRHLFEVVLQRCMAEGLVRGEGFATDASIIKADAQRQRRLPNEEIDWHNPKEATRPVKEYLAALEQANPTIKPDKKISLTDPASSWTAAPGGPAFFAFCTNYLIDLQAGIILDVEASTVSKSAEVAATQKMMERVEERFDLKPERFAADTNYGSAEMLGWLVKEKQITPHVPVIDKSDGKPELFGRSDFTWEAAADRYVCPAGKSLRHSRYKSKNPGQVTKDNTIIYRASKRDCDQCAMKPVCCPKGPGRKIARSIHEDARDLARSLVDTKAYQKSRNERKKVEMLFGHLKRILKMDKLRLRGFSGANDEFLLAATAQNLRRMAQWLGTGPPVYG